MSRSGKVYIHDTYAGILKQNDEGYFFTYDPAYLNSDNPIPISLTLPLKKDAYHSNTIIPFFDGLIPEDWYLEGSELNTRDRMALLLSVCKDSIGAVSILPMEEENHG